MLVGILFAALLKKCLTTKAMQNGIPSPTDSPRIHFIFSAIKPAEGKRLLSPNRASEQLQKPTHIVGEQRNRRVQGVVRNLDPRFFVG